MDQASQFRKIHPGPCPKQGPAFLCLKQKTSFFDKGLRHSSCPKTSWPWEASKASPAAVGRRSQAPRMGRGQEIGSAGANQTHAGRERPEPGAGELTGASGREEAPKIAVLFRPHSSPHTPHTPNSPNSASSAQTLHAPRTPLIQFFNSAAP